MKPHARLTDVLIERTGNELIVYDRVTFKAHCLNETSAAIWELCDGNRDVPVLVDTMRTRFGPECDETIVLNGISQLARAGLLHGWTPKETVVSRRKVSAVVGKAFLVPAVTSVLATAAAKMKSDKPKKNKDEV